MMGVWHRVGAVLSCIGMAVAATAPAMAEPVELQVLEWEGYVSTFKAAFEAEAEKNGLDVRLVFPANANGIVKYVDSYEDIVEALASRGADRSCPLDWCNSAVAV